MKKFPVAWVYLSSCLWSPLFLRSSFYFFWIVRWIFVLVRHILGFFHVAFARNFRKKSRRGSPNEGRKNDRLGANRWTTCTYTANNMASRRHREVLSRAVTSRISEVQLFRSLSAPFFNFISLSFSYYVLI